MAPCMSLRDSRARAERAFGLRAIGRTWREVASELGFKSIGAAQLAVSRHLARSSPESVDTTRRGAVESLRITTSVLFDRFAAAVGRGDDATAALLNRELVRNRDQAARLLGLYAPSQTEVDVRVSASALIADTRERLLAVVDAEVVEEPTKEITP